MSWTDERIQELSRLWQAGLSASEIGKRLGISKNAVVGKAHRLNLPSRPSPIKQAPAQKGTPASGRKARAAPETRAASQSRAETRPKDKADKAEKPGDARVHAVKPASRQSGATVKTAMPQRQPKQAGHRGGCLWPIGDPGDPDFHFCGADALPGKPYCAEHAARAYITRSRDRSEEAA